MTTNFEQLRSHLESEHKRLAGELEQIREASRSIEDRREGSPFGKREEEAAEAFELEKRLAMERRVSDYLAEVEHALQKFAAGTYGLCDTCGQPIARERLEAIPQASLCINCKAQQAKNARS